MKAASFAAVGALALLLTACDQPKPRGEQAGSAQLATTTEPLPAAPAWADEVLGKGLRDAFPETGDCVGNTDGVEMRHRGASPGTKVIGWGWDNAARKRVDRVVLVDKDFKIIGAGESGLPRPDVPHARPDIPAGDTGWAAVTPLTNGAVDSFGVTNDGRGACKLGHIEF